MTRCDSIAKLKEELLLDLSIEDEEIPDEPPDLIDGDWAVFIQDGDGNYLADVLIDPTIDHDALADKLAELVEAVTDRDRPMFVHWAWQPAATTSSLTSPRSGLKERASATSPMMPIAGRWRYGQDVSRSTNGRLPSSETSAWRSTAGRRLCASWS